MASKRIVVIGGGPGGYEAALVAAEHGAEVTLISAEGLGGNSVLWDCVPSKALIVSAEATGWTHSAHRLGVRMQAEVDLAGAATADMAAVMDRVYELSRNQSADIGKKTAADGVHVVEGDARLTDQHTVEVAPDDGAKTSYEADIVLLATGSNPRVLDFSAPDGKRVFTSRELFALRELPSRLVVVGSGATGAEYAQAFARMGCEVHLISSRDQVLPTIDQDAAAVIEDSFQRWGMTIHSQRRAIGLERGDGGVALRMRVEDGSDAEEWLEASHALFCIGQVPASDGLGLAEAGVEVADDGSVPTDGVSRTNVPTIYAAGDVTGQIMLASVAAMQGRNAMWHALGEAVAPLRLDSIAATVFTEPEVANAGMSADEAAEAQIPIDTVTLPFAGNPRAKMAETTDGFVKLHAIKGSGTIVGGSVVSARASDLIAPVSAAVHNRLTAAQLANTSTIYPSMAGSLQEAARQVMSAQA
jgi:dihydrolipoamide dehydrogenase